MASSARIDELKKKFDENPRRYFAPLANEFRKMGDFDQAIIICQEFLPQQPGHMSGHIVFGQALFEAGKLEEARGVFETALGLDPENLIALRQLGDIARAGGDLEGARGWYRRVLDADPRNEEIASLLAGLDEPATVPWTTPTPRSSPAVPPAEASSVSESPQRFAPPAIPEPVAESPVAPAPLEIAPMDFQAMLDEVRGEVEPERAHQAAADSDLIELDESAIEFREGESKVETGAEDLGVERALETPFGFESSSFGAVMSTGGNAGALDGLETTSFEPPEEAPPTLDFLDSESLAPGRITPEHVVPASAAEPPPPPPPPPPPAPVPSAPSASSIDEPMFDSFEIPEVPEAPVTPREEVAAPSVLESAAPSSGGFVTETMAELYVKQGHIAEAIGVYQQLVVRYPNDEVLAARLSELVGVHEAALAEQAEAAAATTPAPVAQEAPAPETSVAEAPAAGSEHREDTVTFSDADIAPEAVSAPVGPTIREFLLDLVAHGVSGGRQVPDDAPRHDGALPEPGASRFADVLPEPEDTGVPSPAGAALDEIASGLDPVRGDALPDEPAAPADLPFIDLGEELASDEGAGAIAHPTADDGAPTVAHSIDSLFVGAEANAADERAASMLAGAFASEVPDAAISGVPAHRADDELSLDLVFRERSAAGEREQPAFSFDQFFSHEASDGGTAAAAGAEPASATAADRDDDIQQFNAWLEGLKKT